MIEVFENIHETFQMRTSIINKLCAYGLLNSGREMNFKLYEIQCKSCDIQLRLWFEFMHVWTKRHNFYVELWHILIDNFKFLIRFH